MKKAFVVGRWSHTEPGVLRLCADSSKQFGTTFVPVIFDNENEATAEVKHRGEGFFAVPVDLSEVPTPAPVG